MKLKILFLCAALITAFAGHSQDAREILYDTVYFQRLPGSAGDTIFFEVRTVVYSDLSEETRKTPIGDSTATRNAVLAFSVDQSRKLANKAGDVIRKSQTISPINTLFTAAAKAGLGDLGRVVQNAFPELIGNYTVKITGSANFAGRIFLNAQGQARIDLASGVTRNVVVFSDALLRVSNYPEGTFTDLYRTEAGKYQSIDKGVVIVKK